MSRIRLDTFNYIKTSRDLWKAKHKQKQNIIRSLKINIRDLNQSRDYWKEKAKSLEVELKKKTQSY